MIAGFPVTGSLRKRVQHIWNAYVTWGIESPAKRKALMQLTVSERITNLSKRDGQAGFEDATEAMRQVVAQGKLSGVALAFASDLLLAMAETTMASKVANPPKAEHYRRAGFEAFWSAAAKSSLAENFPPGLMSTHSVTLHPIDRMEVLMSKVWLVTGSASGLGRDIAEAVLASGDRLLATARDPHRLNDLVGRYGEQVQTAALDVADEAAAKAAVAKAVDVFGRLDIVVNNAGYGDIAPFEQVSSESFRAFDRHELLRCRLCDTRGDSGDAETEEWLRPSDFFCRR
jgi:hypothetical protein